MRQIVRSSWNLPLIKPSLEMDWHPPPSTQNQITQEFARFSNKNLIVCLISAACPSYMDGMGIVVLEMGPLMEPLLEAFQRRCAPIDFDFGHPRDLQRAARGRPTCDTRLFMDTSGNISADSCISMSLTGPRAESCSASRSSSNALLRERLQAACEL
jgi:hypothetical protein